MSMATPKIKQEGMITEQRAASRFANKYRQLADNLLKAERRDELKSDSQSKAEIKTIKAKMADARADFMDTYGAEFPSGERKYSNRPRGIQDLITMDEKDKLALEGTGPVIRQIRRSANEQKSKQNKGGLAKKPTFRNGGSYKGKSHMYAAGGMVKELKI